VPARWISLSASIVGFSIPEANEPCRPVTLRYKRIGKDIKRMKGRVAFINKESLPQL
jgi:hypothetical protein